MYNINFEPTKKQLAIAECYVSDALARDSLQSVFNQALKEIATIISQSPSQTVRQKSWTLFMQNIPHLLELHRYIFCKNVLSKYTKTELDAMRKSRTIRMDVQIAGTEKPIRELISSEAATMQMECEHLIVKLIREEAKRNNIENPHYLADSDSESDS